MEIQKVLDKLKFSLFSPEMIRKMSETIGFETLALWTIEGQRHGFIALEDETEVLYKTTDEYEPSLDRGILWNDPRIGIEWPLKAPVLSAKDAQFPFRRTRRTTSSTERKHESCRHRRCRFHWKPYCG
jgi:hypothetical protein